MNCSLDGPANGIGVDNEDDTNDNINGHGISIATLSGGTSRSGTHNLYYHNVGGEFVE